MPKTYSIVGTEHRRAEKFVAALGVGTSATLVREPNNPFDPLAVAVWIAGKHVGYIPKKQNQALAQFIDQQETMVGDVGVGDIGIEVLAMDSILPLTSKAIKAVFVRSPNSGFPMVEVA